jgi:uncharacterized protein (TIGR03382 family)
MVNVSIAVYGKTGALAAGFPKRNSTMWSVWSGNADPGKAACAARDDGDPIVLYDRMADRWLVSQFAVPEPAYYQCVAVSQTGDPTGQYYLYVFGPYPAMNDYPKIGTWPDGYYATYNMFNPGFVGARVCVWDRAKMLAGAVATEQCFQLGTAYGGLLPSDLDGPRPPPAGSPNIVTSFDIVPGSIVQVWRFHVDWATPGNTSLTGPATIPVNTITILCPGTRQCIPQLGTSNKLDALGDRLMFRAAYRNLGGHESLVLNHTVDPGGGTAGVRWYELRNAAGQTMGSATPVLQQQGTWAPDGNYRWMASVAQDQVGDMAMGYSHSDPTAVTGSYPSIRYAARSWNAAAGTIDLSETILRAGDGYQDSAGSPNARPRWGDYTAMSVDPGDDCTFWYTDEYLPASASGTLAWTTRIGSFRLPTCPPKYAVSGPPTAVAGTPMTVTVTAQDATGATLPFYVGPATLTSGDAQATLPGSAPFTAGVASASVTLKTVGTQTVTATDPLYPTQMTATGSVQVTPGPAASYVVSGFTPPVRAGAAAAFTVTAKDAYGNAATGYAGTAAVTSSDGKAVLPVALTFSAGTAGDSVTFKTRGNQTVTVTDTSNPSITASATVMVEAGASSGCGCGSAPGVEPAALLLLAGLAVRRRLGRRGRAPRRSLESITAGARRCAVGAEGPRPGPGGGP